VKFQVENLDQFLAEAVPLLFAHWKEIAHYEDIELKPDMVAYGAAERAGTLRIFTARDEDNKLVGYSLFFVRRNPHYADSLQASQDIIYIDKNRRGFGARFIKWCDGQLKSEGVQAVYHHVKAKHNFGPLLERMGYELVDYIYAKRLDQPIEKKTITTAEQPAVESI
jgi:GNAT superfamily N-acetyltransferase